jgi:hypothetical protein
MNHTLALTEAEIYETNDALFEVVTRMIEHGQTGTELERRSLGVLWAVLQKVNVAVLGTADTPGSLALAGRVRAAMAAPKTIEHRPFLDT